MPSKKNKKNIVTSTPSFTKKSYKHTLAGVIMVRNEEKGILATIESMLAVCDCIVMLDTGSTDNTVSIVKEACARAGIPLHWKQEIQEPPQWWLEREDTKDMSYFDFSVGRNSLLKLADDKADFLLQCDANDIVMGCSKDHLRTYIDTRLVPAIHDLEKESTSCNILIPYHLKGEVVSLGSDTTTTTTTSKEEEEGTIIVSWVARLVKTKQGLKYLFPVHELLSQYAEYTTISRVLELTSGTEHPSPKKTVAIKVECSSFHLYQDRVSALTMTSTKARYTRDILLLEGYCKEHEVNVHVLYHLAQTYKSIGDREKAYATYEKIVKAIEENALQLQFKELLFSTELRMGEILAKSLNDLWFQSSSKVTPLFHFMNAYKIATHRVEPLLNIIQYYMDSAKSGVCWPLIYMYCHQAAKCVIPLDAIMFVNYNYYKYLRWHLLAIASYYMKEFNECFGALDQIMQNTEDHHLPSKDATNRDSFFLHFVEEGGYEEVVKTYPFSDYVITQVPEKEFAESEKEETYVGNEFIKLAHLMKDQDFLNYLRNSRKELVAKLEDQLTSKLIIKE